MTKEEICKLLHETYGWNLEDLLKNNENQILTLFAACKDEKNNLRLPKNKRD